MLFFDYRSHYYPLTLNGGHSSEVAVSERLQHAEWAATTLPSSDGKQERYSGADIPTNALVVISNGSIYYLPSPSSPAINLSPDADADALSYGVPDLLYQGMQHNTH